MVLRSIRLAALIPAALGLAVIGLSLFVTWNEARPLVDDTLNTGMTLGAALLLLAGFQALPRPAPAVGLYAPFGPLLCCGLYIRVPLLAGALADRLGGPDRAALGALLGHSLIIAAALGLAWRSRVPLRQTFARLPARRQDWMGVLLFIPLMMLAWGELALVLNVSAWLNPAATAGELAASVASDSTLQILLSVFGVLAVTAVGPLSEELVFRGLLLPHWVARRGLSLGLFGSAATFALIHLDFFTALSTLAMGVVTGLVFLRSGSLLLAILIHALYNLGFFLLISLPLFQLSSLEQVGAWRGPGLALLVVGSLWLWLGLRTPAKPAPRPAEA